MLHRSFFVLSNKSFFGNSFLESSISLVIGSLARLPLPAPAEQIIPRVRRAS
jgi:hypothetical protein